MKNKEQRDFAYGVQALRRRAERDLLLGGALGLAAHPLPHQVASVARILTDTSIRHLLADEVGLGKTVQALMVMNALRLEDPELRVVIVVPDTLAMQWRDELRGRAHVAPIEDPDDGARRRPRLVWPRAWKPAQAFKGVDLLIVDELNDLTEEWQKAIERAATEAKQVLVLTATPSFWDGAKLAQLLRVIEPTRRANHAGEVTLDSLRAREHEAIQRRDPDAADPERSSLALREASLRRVIRSRRHDWPEVVPRREHEIHLVEPTEAEVLRERLMWRWFGHLTELDREYKKEKLAERVVRGRASLRERVTYLLGHGGERDGLLRQVDASLGTEGGDSRFERLVEVLQGIWAADPDAVVVVAGRDNLTVDDLAKRLPDWVEGPGGDGLQVLSIRNQTSGPEDVADSDSAIHDAVTKLRAGHAQLLLAANVGSIGLNLQVANHLIFHTLPWDPAAVDQWIGRVDRIHGEGASSGSRSVMVHVIAQRGSVDERVVDVVRLSGVFEHGIGFDSESASTVRAHIQQVALAGAPTDWAELRREMSEVALRREEARLDLPLTEALPWQAAVGRDLAAFVTRRRPIGPVVGASPSGGPEGWTAALAAWVLGMSGDAYDVQRPGRAGVGRLNRHYFAHPTPEQRSRTKLDGDLITRPGGAWFRWSRRALEAAPRQERTRRLAPGETEHDRPPDLLRFLDHGDDLHEGLVDTWLTRATSQARTRPLCFTVRGRDSGLAPGQLLLIMVARADPGELLNGTGPGVAADRRFLRAALPSSVSVVACRLGGPQPAPLTFESVRALFAPPEGLESLPDESDEFDGHRVAGGPEDVERAIGWGAAAAARELQAAWSPLIPALGGAIELRASVLPSDADADARAHEDDAERSRTLAAEAEVSGPKGLVTRHLNVAMEADKRAAAARTIAEARVANLRQALTGDFGRALVDSFSALIAVR